MVEIGMPLEIRVAIARSYEQVRCQLKFENGISKHFLSNMGVKQGYSLSPTFFGLCIDQLQQVINRVTREEELHALKRIDNMSNTYIFFSTYMK